MNRFKLFGRIVNNKMILNKYGIIAQNELVNTPVIRPNVELDEFIIMPDHIHGIIIINDRRGVMPYAPKNDLNNKNDMRAYGNTPLPFAGNIRNNVTSNKYDGNTPLPFMDNVQKNTPLRSPIQTIGSIIRGYKSAVTINVNQIRKTPKTKIWQRNYFERVIRDQKELDKVRSYIRNNPDDYKI